MPRPPHAGVLAGHRCARAGLLLAVLSLAALLGGTPTARGESDTRAAKVEAAYLRHIAEFTTWPEDTFESAKAPLVIGVIGDDHSGVAGIVRRRVEEKGLSAQKHPIALRRLVHPAGDPAARRDFEARLGECHLLYVSDSERETWSELHALLARKAIVTVSEIKGFARRGGMIEFAVDTAADRVRMYIDVGAVKRASLRLSSKLLDLTVVTILDNPPQGEAGIHLREPEKPG